MNNPNCDGSGPHAEGRVRVLPYGGDGNLILCVACHARELAWRRLRNLDLSMSAQYDLPTWNALRVYDPDEV